MLKTFSKPCFVLLMSVVHLMPLSQQSLAAGPAASGEAEPEQGPHRGMMLRDGNFALELAIF